MGRWEEVVDSMRKALKVERASKEEAIDNALINAQKKMQRDMEQFIDKERERHNIEISSLRKNIMENRLNKIDEILENERVQHENAMKELPDEANLRVENEVKR